MTLKLSDIEIAAKLPDWRRSMPVFVARAASFEERQPAIALLQEVWHLDHAQPVEIQGSLHLTSEAGEIEYYRPSGALWAQSAAADDKYPDERRPWNVERAEDAQDAANFKLVLMQGEQDKLAEEAADLFNRAGLMSEEAYFASVDLDQVAQIDEEGQEVERFAGEATARFLYQLDGIMVDGPGAKTYAYYNPGEGLHELGGLYHAWRQIEDARTVQMVGIEEVLERTLVRDRELILHHEKTYALTVTEIELIYFTMPPFKHQGYVFPALRVIGSAMPKDPELKRDGFEFARFYNAVLPEEYAKAELYADYLVLPL